MSFCNLPFQFSPPSHWVVDWESKRVVLHHPLGFNHSDTVFLEVTWRSSFIYMSFFISFWSSLSMSCIFCYLCWKCQNGHWPHKPINWTSSEPSSSLQIWRFVLFFLWISSVMYCALAKLKWFSVWAFKCCYRTPKHHSLNTHFKKTISLNSHENRTTTLLNPETTFSRGRWGSHFRLSCFLFCLKCTSYLWRSKYKWW